jgi:hypothetical protein
LRPANGKRTIPRDHATNPGGKVMKLLRSGLFVAATAIVMAVAAQAQDSPQRKELRRVDLSGTAGMEVVSSISEFKPGEELPRHLHHGVEAGYVVQGEPWCRTPGNRPRCWRPLRRSSIFAMWFMVDSRWSVPAT